MVGLLVLPDDSEAAYSGSYPTQASDLVDPFTFSSSNPYDEGGVQITESIVGSTAYVGSYADHDGLFVIIPAGSGVKITYPGGSTTLNNNTTDTATVCLPDDGTRHPQVCGGTLTVPEGSSYCVSGFLVEVASGSMVLSKPMYNEEIDIVPGSVVNAYAVDTPGQLFSRFEVSSDAVGDNKLIAYSDELFIQDGSFIITDQPTVYQDLVFRVGEGSMNSTVSMYGQGWFSLRQGDIIAAEFIGSDKGPSTFTAEGGDAELELAQYSDDHSIMAYLVYGKVASVLKEGDQVWVIENLLNNHYTHTDSGILPLPDSETYHAQSDSLLTVSVEGSARLDSGYGIINLAAGWNFSIRSYLDGSSFVTIQSDVATEEELGPPVTYPCSIFTMMSDRYIILNGGRGTLTTAPGYTFNTGMADLSSSGKTPEVTLAYEGSSVAVQDGIISLVSGTFDGGAAGESICIGDLNFDYTGSISFNNSGDNPFAVMGSGSELTAYQNSSYNTYRNDSADNITLWFNGECIANMYGGSMPAKADPYLTVSHGSEVRLILMNGDTVTTDYVVAAENGDFLFNGRYSSIPQAGRISYYALADEEYAVVATYQVPNTVGSTAVIYPFSGNFIIDNGSQVLLAKGEIVLCQLASVTLRETSQSENVVISSNSSTIQIVLAAGDVLNVQTGNGPGSDFISKEAGTEVQITTYSPVIFTVSNGSARAELEAGASLKSSDGTSFTARDAPATAEIDLDLGVLTAYAEAGNIRLLSGWEARVQDALGSDTYASVTPDDSLADVSVSDTIHLTILNTNSCTITLPAGFFVESFEIADSPATVTNIGAGHYNVEGGNLLLPSSPVSGSDITFTLAYGIILKALDGSSYTAEGAAVVRYIEGDVHLESGPISITDAKIFAPGSSGEYLVGTAELTYASYILTVTLRAGNEISTHVNDIVRTYTAPADGDIVAEDAEGLFILIEGVLTILPGDNARFSRYEIEVVTGSAQLSMSESGAVTVLQVAASGKVTLTNVYDSKYIITLASDSVSSIRDADGEIYIGEFDGTVTSSNGCFFNEIQCPEFTHETFEGMNALVKLSVSEGRVTLVEGLATLNGEGLFVYTADCKITNGSLGGGNFSEILVTYDGRVETQGNASFNILFNDGISVKCSTNEDMPVALTADSAGITLTPGLTGYFTASGAVDFTIDGHACSSTAADTEFGVLYEVIDADNTDSRIELETGGMKFSDFVLTAGDITFTGSATVISGENLELICEGSASVDYVYDSAPYSYMPGNSGSYRADVTNGVPVLLEGSITLSDGTEAIIGDNAVLAGSDGLVLDSEGNLTILAGGSVTITCPSDGNPVTAEFSYTAQELTVLSLNSVEITAVSGTGTATTSGITFIRSGRKYVISSAVDMQTSSDAEKIGDASNPPTLDLYMIYGTLQVGNITVSGIASMTYGERLDIVLNASELVTVTYGTESNKFNASGSGVSLSADITSGEVYCESGEFSFSGTFYIEYSEFETGVFRGNAAITIDARIMAEIDGGNYLEVSGDSTVSRYEAPGETSCILYINKVTHEAELDSGTVKLAGEMVFVGLYIVTGNATVETAASGFAMVLDTGKSAVVNYAQNDIEYFSPPDSGATLMFTADSDVPRVMDGYVGITNGDSVIMGDVTVKSTGDVTYVSADGIRVMAGATAVLDRGGDTITVEVNENSETGYGVFDYSGGKLIYTSGEGRVTFDNTWTFGYAGGSYSTESVILDCGSGGVSLYMGSVTLAGGARLSFGDAVIYGDITVGKYTDTGLSIIAAGSSTFAVMDQGSLAVHEYTVEDTGSFYASLLGDGSLQPDGGSAMMKDGKLSFDDYIVSGTALISTSTEVLNATVSGGNSIIFTKGTDVSTYSAPADGGFYLAYMLLWQSFELAPLDDAGYDGRITISVPTFQGTADYTYRVPELDAALDGVGSIEYNISEDQYVRIKADGPISFTLADTSAEYGSGAAEFTLIGGPSLTYQQTVYSAEIDDVTLYADADAVSLVAGDVSLSAGMSVVIGDGTIVNAVEGSVIVADDGTVSVPLGDWAEILLGEKSVVCTASDTSKEPLTVIVGADGVSHQFGYGTISLSEGLVLNYDDGDYTAYSDSTEFLIDVDGITMTSGMTQIKEGSSASVNGMTVAATTLDAYFDTDGTIKVIPGGAITVTADNMGATYTAETESYLSRSGSVLVLSDGYGEFAVPGTMSLSIGGLDYSTMDGMTLVAGENSNTLADGSVTLAEGASVTAGTFMFQAVTGSLTVGIDLLIDVPEGSKMKAERINAASGSGGPVGESSGAGVSLVFEADADSVFSLSETQVTDSGAIGTMSLTGISLSHSQHLYATVGSATVVLGDASVSLTAGTMAIETGADILVGGKPLSCNAGTISVTSDGSVSLENGSKMAYSNGGKFTEFTATSASETVLSSGKLSYVSGSGTFVAPEESVLEYGGKEYAVTGTLTVSPSEVELTDGAVTLQEGAVLILSGVKISSVLGAAEADADGNIGIPAEGKATVIFAGGKADCTNTSLTDVLQFQMSDNALTWAGGTGNVSLDSGLTLVHSQIPYISSSAPTVFNVDESGVYVESGLIAIPAGTTYNIFGMTVSATLQGAYADSDGRVTVSAGGKVSVKRGSYVIDYSAVSGSSILFSDSSAELESGYGTVTVTGPAGLDIGEQSFSTDVGMTVAVTENANTLDGGTAVLSEGSSLTVGTYLIQAVSGSFTVGSDYELIMSEGSRMKATGTGRSMAFEAAASSFLTLSETQVINSGAKGALSITGLELNYNQLLYIPADTATVELGEGTVSLASGTVSFGTGASILLDGNQVSCNGGTVTVSSDGTIGLENGSNLAYEVGSDLTGYTATSASEMKLSSGKLTYGSGSGIFAAPAESVFVYGGKEYAVTGKLTASASEIKLTEGSATMQEGATLALSEVKVVSVLGGLEADSNGNISIPSEGKASVVFNGGKADCTAAASGELSFLAYADTLSWNAGSGTVSLDSGLSLMHGQTAYMSSSAATLFDVNENGVTVVSGVIIIPAGTASEVLGMIISANGEDAYVDQDNILQVLAGGEAKITYGQKFLTYAADTESRLKVLAAGAELLSGTGGFTTSGELTVTCGGNDYALSGGLSVGTDVRITSGTVTISEGVSIKVGDASVTCVTDMVIVNASSLVSLPVNGAAEVEFGEKSVGYTGDDVTNFFIRTDGIEIDSGAGTVALSDTYVTKDGQTFTGTGTVAFGQATSIGVYGTNSIAVGNVTYTSRAGDSFSAIIDANNGFELQEGTVLIPEGIKLRAGNHNISVAEGNVYLAADGVCALTPMSVAVIAPYSVAGAVSSDGYKVTNSAEGDVTFVPYDIYTTLAEFYQKVGEVRTEIEDDPSGIDTSDLIAKLDVLIYDAFRTYDENVGEADTVLGDYLDRATLDYITKFEAYKAELISQIDALHNNGETATASKIIESAKSAVSKTYYSRDLTYTENRARLSDYQPDKVRMEMANNEEELFNAYKQKVLDAIDALHAGETCRGEVLLINEAYAAAQQVYYSPDTSILENQLVLDNIYYGCKADVGEYRTGEDAFYNYIDVKKGYLETQDTFGSKDAVELVQNCLADLAIQQYVSSESISDNLARIDAIMAAFDKSIRAIAVNEFTAYKTAQLAALAYLYEAHTEPEIRVLISKAQSQVGAVYYAPNMPYANSVLRISETMANVSEYIDVFVEQSKTKFAEYCDKYVAQFEKSLAKFEGDEPVGDLTPGACAKIAESIRSAIRQMDTIEYDSTLNLAANKARADKISNDLSTEIYQISGEEALQKMAEYYVDAVNYVSTKVISGATDKINDLVDTTKDELAAVYEDADFFDPVALIELKEKIDETIANFDVLLQEYVATADYDRVVDAAVDYLEERYSSADAATVARMDECISLLRNRDYDDTADLEANQHAIEDMTNRFSVELFTLRMKSIKGEFESYRDYLVWTLSGKNSENSTPGEIRLARECTDRLKAVEYADVSLLQNTQALDAIYSEYLERSAELAKKEQSEKFILERNQLVRDLKTLKQTEVLKQTLGIIQSVVFDPSFSYEENIYGLRYLEAVATESVTDSFLAAFSAYKDGIFYSVRGENQYDQSETTRNFITGYMETIDAYAFDAEQTYLANMAVIADLYGEFKAGLVELRYLDNSTTLGNINADGTSVTGGEAEYPEGETQIWGIIANAGGLGDGAAATIERVSVPRGVLGGQQYAAEGSVISVLGNGKALGAFDVSIYNGGEKVSSFNGTYRVMILLPADMRGYEEMQVAYADEFGNLQVYDAQVEGNYLVFYTAHFSTFYVVGLVEDHPEYDAYVYIAVFILVLLVLFCITHVVRFDANGGTGTTGTIIYLGQGDGNLPAGGFAREGYRFAGWSRSSEAGAEVIADGAELQSLGKYRFMKLYAVWEEDSQGGKE